MDNFFDREKYEKYFNLPHVIDIANKIFDITKDGNEMLNDDEKIASIILAYDKLKQYYEKNK